MMKQDPHTLVVVALGEAMSGRDPKNAILEAEAAGQAAMLASVNLPADMGDSRPIFEAMGIRFGRPGDDPLFLPATLPPGWRKEATDHAMYSRLIDDRGRERATIFYKAAFYDRSANMTPSRRYSVSYANPESDPGRQWGAYDGKTLLWATERVPEPTRAATQAERLAFYDRNDELRAQAVAWLDTNRPDWRNPLAYWDE